MSDSKPILGFFSKYRVYSNFHLRSVLWEGHEFPSNENAYQWAKSHGHQAEDLLAVFQTCSPSEAKRLGTTISLRPGWDEYRIEVMFELNLQKYSSRPLRSVLLGTGSSYLEETNWWHDNFWGVCRGSREAVLAGVGTTCPRCHGKGKNLLGEILMEVRTMLAS